MMMKKALMLTITLLMTAAAASAWDLELSGRFLVEGSYYDNFVPSKSDTLRYNPDPDVNQVENWSSSDKIVEQNARSWHTSDKYQFADYDMNWRLDAKLSVTPATKVITRVIMHKETWGLRTDENGSWDGAQPAEGQELNDNISIQRAYLSHWFSPRTNIEIGMTPGGGWSTNFANSGSDRAGIGGRFLRVGVGPLDYAMLIISKAIETGSYNDTILDVNQERDDWDNYILLGSFRTGPVTWFPLFSFSDRNHINASTDDPINPKSGARVDGQREDLRIYTPVLGATGTHGMIGWEAEASYNYYKFRRTLLPEDEEATWGMYGNVWANFDMAKVGAWAAYGSYQGVDGIIQVYAFGDDFDSSIIIGDDMGPEDLVSATAFALYADITPMEKLTISPLFTYHRTNIKEEDQAFIYQTATWCAWQGFDTGMEFDLVGTYQLTDEVKYSVGFAYAQVTFSDTMKAFLGRDDFDPAMKVFHELRLDF